MLSQFNDKKILIVGDIILDKYVMGTVSRISPEAPVPIVDVHTIKYVLGGAANVANNIAALGGQAHLYGCVGKDYNGDMTIDAIEKNKILLNGVLRTEDSTTVKTRVIAHNQQVVRVDNETKTRIDLDKFYTQLERVVSDFDMVVLSDYAKGIVTERLRPILAKAKCLLIDPRPQNVWMYPHNFIITPNNREAQKITGLADSRKSCLQFKKICRSSNVLITKGKDGVFLFRENGECQELQATAKEVFDVTGAGDTLISVLALCIASNISIVESCKIANVAAGIVVGKVGTATINQSELEEGNACCNIN